MTRIQVKDATLQDVAFIVQCNIAMAEETEDKGLDPATLQQGITYLFNHAQEGFYLLAEVDGAPAGTLMVTFEWSDWRNGRFWWIQSVYVAERFRRQGVYQAMHEQVIKRAQQDPQSCGIRLYVEQDNRVAQQTYRALGMTATDYRLYEAIIRRPE